MKARSLGPYTFVEYSGRKGVNATVEDLLGRRYYVSAANLLPTAREAARLDRFSTRLPGTRGASESGRESTVVPSSGDSQPPPGTIVLGEWTGG
jgi:hypothetical protein